ncbi:MAG: hypothetical protein H8E55_66320 [Pelagibacterales bacterium]|nr:hypothetical protein [Pelagibacterales bacterium]
MDSKKLYEPFVSKAKNKKYSVYVKADTKSGKKLIHFGDNRYQQYKDKLGYYRHLDHNDKQRRKAYYARHGKAIGKDNAKYFSHKYLW